MIEIMDIMNEIEYGFKDESGFNLALDEARWDKFFEFYYLLSPEELLEKKCGVCWDQVELERKLFTERNLHFATYFIYIDDSKNLPSHTFLVCEENNKYYWFEHSWGDYQGIFEYPDINSLLKDVKEKFIMSRIDEVDGNYEVKIYKYQQPPYHITCAEFYDFIKKETECFI